MFPTLPDGLFVCFCYDLYVISEGDREDTDPSRNLLIATFDTDFIKFLQNRINIHIFLFSLLPDPSLHVPDASSAGGHRIPLHNEDYG